MINFNQRIVKLVGNISGLLGLGKLKAVLIGIFGMLYAHLSYDQHLLILTIGFTVLAYIVYAMEWGLKNK